MKRARWRIRGWLGVTVAAALFCAVAGAWWVYSSYQPGGFMHGALVGAIEPPEPARHPAARVFEDAQQREMRSLLERAERERRERERHGFPPQSERHEYRDYVRREQRPSQLLPDVVRVVEQFGCPVCGEPHVLADGELLECSVCSLAMEREGPDLWLWRGQDIRAEQEELLGCMEDRLSPLAGTGARYRLWRRASYLEGLLGLAHGREDPLDVRVARIFETARSAGHDVGPCRPNGEGASKT